MKVSIIVPVYKVEKYIANCIKSIINQDYPNLEIILVDDKTPDQSIFIATKILEQNNSKYKVLKHLKNQGLSAARNSGMQAATGEYIYFIDSDDELSGSDVISKFVTIAKSTNADCVVGNYVRIYPGQEVISIYKHRLSLPGSSFVTAFIDGKFPITAWNKLIKTSWLRSNNIWFMEGVVTEDELFAYEMLFKLPNVELAGIVSYRYMMREDSISSSFKGCRIQDSLKVYDEILNSYRKSNINDSRLLTCFDRIAFNHYIEIENALISEQEKYNAYKSLAKKQSSYLGKSKYRIFSFHIYTPKPIGFGIMKLITKFYCYIKR